MGDCLFIPAGTVHALGAGLVVAEIQQASDTTFRIFDWNRVGPDGKPRQLHIEQALDVIDFERGPVVVQQPEQTDCPHVQRLVACDKFIVNRWEFSGSQAIGGDDRCHLIAVLAGKLEVAGEPLDAALVPGQTCLLPAVCREVVIQATGRTVLLEIFLP